MIFGHLLPPKLDESICSFIVRAVDYMQNTSNPARGDAKVSGAPRGQELLQVGTEEATSVLFFGASIP